MAMCGFAVFWEKGDAGPLEPIDDREESRWWENRPTDLGVSWPLDIHISVCIASPSGKKGADDSGAARPLCRTGWNNEGSARVGVGMLSKAERGEYWDSSDCVEMGDDDKLL